ncbi:fungal-specific transcription factor domain-containing protein [Nemania abortiva]|nr:fungal-specific transcription factor domain-containing protein [Nemania abortiva]
MGPHATTGGDRGPSTSTTIPQGATRQPSTGRFQCPITDCRKVFNRKEHVTRHLKSHNPNAEHQCHICGRRYVRKDVLRRHVSGHGPQPAAPPPITSTADRRLIPDQSKDGNEDIALGFYPEPDTLASIDGALSHELHAQWQQPQPHDQDTVYTAEWATTIATFTDSEISDLFSDDTAVPTDTPGLAQTSSEPLSLVSESLTDTADPAPNDPQLQTRSNSPCGADGQHNDGQHNNLMGAFLSALETQTLVQVFFTRIHPYWPILHPATFEVESAPKRLLSCMVLLAAHHEGSAGREELADAVFSALTGPELMSNPSVHVLQSLLLYVVYCLGRPAVHNMTARATYLNATLISTCRRLGVFDDRYLDRKHIVEQSPLSTWLAREQLHRLAFAVFCADTYISILQDHPPTVRYQELQIPLPMSMKLWGAVGDAERRKLQWQEPAGRQKVLFSSILRDILEDEPRMETPYQLGLTGSHLGLCALWSGVWEAVREAHSSAADELYAKHLPGSPFFKWRQNVSLWQMRMEENCALQQRYFLPTATDSGSVHPSRAPTLILGHLYHLHMHAPVRLIQTIACGDESSTKLNEARGRLHTWLNSPCPRISVWNAAQISRVIEHESASRSGLPDAVQNPCAITSLLTSAIVVCFVAHLTCACSPCGRNTGEKPSVDLFNSPEDDVGLTQWRDFGVGVASWGLSSIAVCRCKTGELASWFRRHLHRDTGIEAEFLSFVDSLQIISISI